MKTCVLITGTNAVGKSSVAWSVINRHGGVVKVENDVTYLAEGDICLAGRYDRLKYGGVDRIVNDKGSSCTSRLPEVVEEGLRHNDVIVCEGMYLNTFGLNLTNALFKAERQLVVNLYADMQTLYSRIIGRSNGKKNDGARNWPTIWKKQIQAMRAARKFQKIGVPVLQFNTAEASTEEIVDVVLSKISELCGKDMTTR